MKHLIADKSSPISNQISLHYYERRNSGLYVAQPLILAEQQEGRYCEPLLRIDQAVAQEFMDSLWQCGIRPSDGSGSAGSLAATQKHLSDMRKIVSKELMVDL